VKLNLLLNMPASTEGLEWGEQSSPRPGRFTTGKEPRYLMQKTPGGGQGGLDGVLCPKSADGGESPFVLQYSRQQCENIGYIKSICTNKSVS